MRKKSIDLILTFIVICTLSELSKAQVYIQVNMTQPAPLICSAGSDKTIPAGGSTAIGGIITGGVMPYTYDWTPLEGLSDASIANPVASPGVTITYYLTVTDANACVDIDSMVVYVGNTGINAFDQSTAFTISPNPATGSFSVILPDHLRNGSVNLQIYNSIGKLVYATAFSNAKAKQAVPVQLSGMPKGVYLVKLIPADGFARHQKLILE